MKGDSFRRQSQLAIEYVQRHGLELDTTATFHDLGTSAYRGKNAETGALSYFLRAVEDGHIVEGSYLLVESLDRISRANILDALPLFMRVVNLGVILVTLNDQRVYSRESIVRDQMELLVSMLVLIRGNEESATKARRLKAAWESKRTLAAEGKLVTKIVPGWVHVTADQKMEAIPERAEVVRRIYSLFLDGMGKERIAQLLNAEGIATWGTVNKNAAKHWQTSYVTKILDNPAVVGTFVTRTTEVSQGRTAYKEALRIEGYYPRVIDDESFARVRAIRDTASVTRVKGTSPPRNLLAGLSVCPLCFGSMIRVNKGYGGKGGKPYLICSKAKAGAGCTYKTVGLVAVETAMRQGFRELAQALGGEGGPALAEEIEKLQWNIDALEEMLSNAAKAITRVGASATLSRRLRELEAEHETATATIREKRALLYAQTHVMRHARVDQLQPLLESEDVPKANLLLRELLRSVVVNYQTGYLECHTKAGTRVDLLYAWIGDAGLDEEDPKDLFISDVATGKRIMK